MRTIFEQSKANWSNKAHLSARKTLYPLIFDCDASELSYESTTISDGGEKNRILDGSLAIDRTVSVECGLNNPIKYTVQERFRKKRFSRYRDLTITEWNHQSNLPSELYKISALLFLYAYWDDRTGFGEAIVLNTLNLLEMIKNGDVSVRKRLNHKKQSFICVPFDELMTKQGVVFFHYSPFSFDNLALNELPF